MPALDPTDPATARKIIRGILDRIAATYDADTYGPRAWFFYPGRGEVELLITTRERLGVHLATGEHASLDYGQLSLPEVVDQAEGLIAALLSPAPSTPAAPADEVSGSVLETVPA